MQYNGKNRTVANLATPNHAKVCQSQHGRVKIIIQGSFDAFAFDAAKMSHDARRNGEKLQLKVLASGLVAFDGVDVPPNTGVFLQHSAPRR